MAVAMRAVLLVATAIAVSLAVHAAVTRRLRPDRVVQAQQSAGIVIEALAGLYGVLVAFILAGAWERFDEMRGTLTLEANALADLRQIARVLPAPAGDEFGAALEAYREGVLEELRLHREGRSVEDAGADAAVGRLWRILVALEPATSGEGDLQSRGLDAVEELGDMRRVRLLGLQRTLPPVLWVMLVGGGIAVLGVTVLSSVGGRLTAAYLALLTAMISFALFSIYVLSCPVRSGLAEEMSPALEQLRERAREGAQ